MTYLEKLLDPRWQRKRLMVFDRAGWACENCGSREKTLHVHHLIYSKGEPWDAPDKTLECLCVDCHDLRTDMDRVGGRYLISTKTMTSDPGVQKSWKRYSAEVKKLNEIQGREES